MSYESSLRKIVNDEYKYNPQTKKMEWVKKGRSGTSAQQKINKNLEKAVKRITSGKTSSAQYQTKIDKTNAKIKKLESELKNKNYTKGGIDDPNSFASKNSELNQLRKNRMNLEAKRDIMKKKEKSSSSKEKNTEAKSDKEIFSKKSGGKAENSQSVPAPLSKSESDKIKKIIEEKTVSGSVAWKLPVYSFKLDNNHAFFKNKWGDKHVINLETGKYVGLDKLNEEQYKKLLQGVEYYKKKK